MTGAWAIRFIPMGGAKFTKVTRETHGEPAPATRRGTAGGEGGRVRGCRKMRWIDRNLRVFAPVTVIRKFMRKWACLLLPSTRDTAACSSSGDSRASRLDGHGRVAMVTGEVA